MRTPNILRDQIYGIIADQSMDPAAKAAAIRDAGKATAASVTAPSIQMPASTMALPDAPGPGGAFSRALSSQYAPSPPPLASGQAPAVAPLPPTGAIPPPVPPPTAAFPDVAPAPAPVAAFPNVAAPPSAAFPDATPPGLGDEIDRRRALAVAALGNPTISPPALTMPSFPMGR